VTNQAKCPRCKGSGVNRWRVKGRVGGWSDPVECDRCGGHGTLVHQSDDDREPIAEGDYHLYDFRQAEASSD
jgi:DnaJ-class molecular chaperone